MNSQTAVQPGGDTSKCVTHGLGFLGTQVETDFSWTWTLRN